MEHHHGQRNYLCILPQRKKERERERERICPCVTQFMITWAPYDRVKRVWTSESDTVKPGFEFQFSSIPSCVLLSKLILLQNINYLNHILKGVRIWESNIIHVSIKIFNYKQQRHILANLSRRGIYSRLSCCFQHFWEGWRTRREKEGPRKAEQQPGPQGTKKHMKTSSPTTEHVAATASTAPLAPGSRHCWHHTSGCPLLGSPSLEQQIQLWSPMISWA